MKQRYVVLLTALALLRPSLHAATFTVTNANPSGTGSLQQAILDANSNPGPDTIAFNIAGGTTIAPTNPLPVITDTLTIDGSTQPGYSNAPVIELSGVSAGAAANGLVIAADNCVIRALAVTGFQGDTYETGDGIQITNAAGSVVEGCYLGIERDGVTPSANYGAGVRIGYPAYYDGPTTSNNIIGGTNALQRNLISGNYYGIFIDNSVSNLVIGNYIGTDLTGTFAVANSNAGVTLSDYYCNYNIIGGTNTCDRNLISGNGTAYYYSADGVYFTGGISNAVWGNYIGVDVTGTKALPNLRHGVNIQYGGDNYIGGSGAGQPNLISGNFQNGVNIGGFSEEIADIPIINYTGTPAPNPDYGNIVQGNLIGTDKTGNSPIPNGNDGVYISNEGGNLVGGYLNGEGNVIKYNTNNGVEIIGYGSSDYNAVLRNLIYANMNCGVIVGYGAIGCPISSNAIWGNTNIGIDLNADGVTMNDDGDGDFGANYLQNFPVLGFPISDGTNTVITGTLNSAADTVYNIELFDNDNPDPSGYGQGQRFIGNLSVTTDDSGNASFSFTNPAAISYNHWISATATDSASNTSEFSYSRQVVSPDSVDLVVGLSGDPSPAPKSAPYNYVIGVTNYGPATATGVTMTNPLPAGLNYIYATSTQGSCGFSGGVVTANIGTLAPGEGAQINLIVTASVTGTITDTVGAYADESDNTPSDNTASMSTQFGLADLTVGGTSLPDPVIAGQPVTFTVTGTNQGPDDGTQVTLSLSVDGSFIVTSASASAGTLTQSANYAGTLLDTLPVNGTVTLTVTAVPTQDGTFSQYASITGNETDTNNINNSASLETDVDAGPGVIQFTSGYYTVSESGVMAVIGVMRTGGAIGTVSVDYSTANLTAIGGIDYAPTSGTLTFLNGQSNKTFSVPIIDGGTTDCNKSLRLALSNPMGAAVLIGQTNATLEIFNSHPTPTGAVQGVSLAKTNIITAGDSESDSPSISDDGHYIAFASSAHNLVLTPDNNGSPDIFVYDRQSGTNALVTVNYAETQASDGSSAQPQISGDGSEIAFFSSADNLTTNAASGYQQVFARARAGGPATLISVNTNGAAANAYSDLFSISSNGTKIAFRSYGSDLAANDTNSSYDIFYRDLASNSVALVSINGAGTGPGNNYSTSPKVSGNGRFVAFGSYATDLVANDVTPRLDIFRRDMLIGATVLISANTGGFAGNNACGSDIYINGDGRYVAYESYDTDLVPAGPPGYYQEIFLRDAQNGTNIPVSVNNSNVYADSYCTLYGLSADARYVLFGTTADNLTTNATNYYNQSLYIRDVVSNTTRLVTVNSSGTAPGNGSVFSAVLSANGRYVLFTSPATDLVTNSTSQYTSRAYVRDLVNNTTTLLDTTYGGSTGGNGDANEPAVSSTGVAAFQSYASDLAESDFNNSSDVFVRATTDSSPTLASFGIGVTGNAQTFDQQVTSDGFKVAIASYAENLIDNDTNSASDIFLYTLATHSMELISANAANNGPQGGNSDSPRPSTDGHFVAYHNVSPVEPEIVTASTIFNSVYDQIYLRDAVSNVTELVSVNYNGTDAGDGPSINPQITPDGQYVVFESQADDLVTNDFNGTTSEVYIRNRNASACELVSLNAAGIAAGNSDSRAPSVSADGRYVSFETYASDLGPADNNNHFDVYVRDRLTGTNILCSRNLGGTDGGNNDSFGSFLSANGSKVVFFSYATDLVSNGGVGNGNLYVFDIASGTVQSVSVNTNGAVGNSSAFQPSITADGRYVAFYSDSTDLVTNAVTSQGDVYVRDLVAGTTALVSVACDGSGAGTGYSDLPQISANGGYVTFHSYAIDLVPGNFSHDSGSVFRRDLQAGATVLVSQNETLSGEGDGNSYNPTISGNGSVISFLSQANDLIAKDANGTDDAFAWSTGVSGIDLTLTMSESVASLHPGGSVTYILTVTNYGLTNATGVVVTNVLPAGLTFVSASTTLGSYTNAGGVVSFNIGALNILAGAQMSITATVSNVGLFTNTASTTALQPDFNLANNDASAVLAVTLIGPPLLSVSTTNVNQISLSWPSESTGFNLETKTNIMTNFAWLPVTNSVSSNGPINFVIFDINTNEPQRYFRLDHP